MKSASGPLIALLNSGADFQMADLWTLTLNGGAVVRWCGADRPLVANGHAYPLGPVIERGGVVEKRGLEVATLVMTIIADGADLINGAPIIPFIRRRGLDGANVRLDRAFLADWDQPVVGTIIRFAGRVTSVGEITGNSAKVTISSWSVLLNVNMPAELYQAGCLHSVYDAGCGLNPASFSAASTVSGTPTLSSFGSGLTGHAGLYSQGRILFTSGPNAGISRSVKSNDAGGGFVLIQSLPNLPAAGNAFTAYAGCDLTKGTCSTRFNNLGRFKGAPFIPVPETVF